MKTLFSFAVVLATLLFAPIAPAQTQGLFTGLPTLLSASSTSNAFPSGAIQIHKGQSLTILPDFACGAAGTNGNIIATVQMNPDINNASFKWTTLGNPTASFLGNGTTEVVGIAVFVATNFLNEQYVRIWLKNEGTNVCNLTNVVYSITD